MLFSPDKNGNGENIFPILNQWETFAQIIVMALLTSSLLFLIDAAVSHTALSAHSYYRSFILLAALLLGALITPHLVRRYALKCGRPFGTREERLKESQKASALVLGVTMAAGWGISMWIIFTSYLTIEYGWHPSMLFDDLLLWLGAGVLMGVITAYQSKW